MKKNLGLVPLRNFADMGEGIFRCAQPLYDYEYQWVRQMLGVDIIFNLRKELHRDEKYGVKHGMQVISIEIPDHQEPTLEQALSFIGQVHHALAYGQKILIHCEHGHGRTSTFAVLARLAQGWTLEHALQEEEEVFHYCFNHPAQKEFLIKNFTNYGQSAQGLAS